MNAAHALALALLLATLAVAVPTAGDGNPPVVEDVRWSPFYPIHPSNVTISAKVTDVDGLLRVQAIFCYIPPFLCLFQDLADPDLDGVWEGVPKGPGDVSTHADALGATLNVYAEDMASNSIYTEKVNVLFVTSLNLSLDDGTLASGPGEAVTVSGIAHYNGNASAPASGVTVGVTLNGSTTSTTVDGTGAFSISVTAPGTDGTYDLVVTATDRSLTGLAEGTLAVTTVPRPDLVVDSLAVVSSHAAVEGRSYGVSFRARNVGTLDASQARIVGRVLHEGSVQEAEWLADLAARGPGRTYALNWTLGVGSYVVEVSIDPDGAFEEINEANNARNLTVVSRAFDPTGLDADGDEDGDGYTNAEEVRAGSDPRDPNSVPAPAEPREDFPLVLFAAVAGLAVLAAIGVALVVLLRRRNGAGRTPPRAEP